MNNRSPFMTRFFLAIALLFVMSGAYSQENVIRKNLAERYPALPPVSSVSPTDVAGIFEVRVGADYFYTDANADFVFQGSLINTRTKQNLTTLRKNEATQASMQVPFASLPLQNAFKHSTGTGLRQLAVFVDPNCSFCKKLEVDLSKLNDVTIHYILLPVLGEDSQKKAERIFCAKDKSAVWFDWMLKGLQPPDAQCEAKTVLSQNLDFAAKNNIAGTPTMFLVTGRRIVGALPFARLEQLLNDPKAE